jgi:hypothetical protein
MKAFVSASMVLILSMAATVASAAEEFDGSLPLACKPDKGHDCLPAEKSCKPLKREPGAEEISLGIDVANKQVRSPFRTSLLPIQYVTQNKESLVLQGADLQFAWSTVIHRTKGTFTLTIADRKGAYVVFGQCAVAPATPAATTPPATAP